MREDEFRARLRGALGEPPHLAPPELGAPAHRSPRTDTVAMGVLAATLAVVLVAVLVSTRVLLHPTGGLVPAASPSPVSRPTAAPGSFPCALPVVVTVEADNQGQNPLIASGNGFLNLPAGAY